MSRRLPPYKVLELVRRPLRRLKPWCEWIALIVAIVMTYTRLRMEIGDWQALLATAGVPLAVLDGPWNSRLAIRQVCQRFRDSLVGLSRPAPDEERTPALWVSPTPYG